MPMNEEVLTRLIEAIERDPRKANRISTDAGLGRNYVRSIVEEGKSPKADTLIQLLNALGNDALIYVLTGHQISEEDLEFLSLISDLSPEAKQSAIGLFRGLLERE